MGERNGRILTPNELNFTFRVPDYKTCKVSSKLIENCDRRTESQTDVTDASVSNLSHAMLLQCDSVKMVQFADDINRVVFRLADAVRRIKEAIVRSFEDGVKQPQPKCCPLEPLNFTVDWRFPGLVTTVCIA